MCQDFVVRLREVARELGSVTGETLFFSLSHAREKGCVSYVMQKNSDFSIVLQDSR